MPGIGGLTQAPAGRSNNVNAWKPEDFRVARAEHDPRLLAAIATLGAGRASSDKAAALLVELLKAPANALPTGSAPVDPATGAPPASPGTDQPAPTTVPVTTLPGQPVPPPTPVMTEDVVVAAIVDSLGANNTTTARAALKKLLLGELKTSVPDAAVTGLAAKALLKKPAKDEEELLLAAAVNPAQLRPGAAVDPALHAQFLAALAERAPANLRSALMDAALRKSVPDEKRQAIVDLLMKPDPANFSAQAKLYQSDVASSSTKDELLRRFTTFSTAAIDQLLGARPANELPSDSPGSRDSTGLLPIVESIWSEEVIAQLAKYANDAPPFPQAYFTASIPQTSARAIFGEMGHDLWDKGPTEMGFGELYGGGAHDPGLLIVSKRMPRKDEPKEQKPRTKRAAEAAAAAGTTGTGRRGRWQGQGQEPGRAEREEKARYAWMHGTEDFVRNLNSRFLAAAQSGAGQRHMIAEQLRRGRTPSASSVSTSAEGVQQAESRAARFPLELHDGAQVLAEYHVCWPDDLPKRLQNSSITPLAVHYVQIEEMATMTKLNTHYLKQLKGVQSHVRSYGRWLDWMGQGVEHGQARTVDIIISKKKPAKDGDEESTASRRGAEESELLAIEILVVEIPEYRASPIEEESAAKTK